MTAAAVLSLAYTYDGNGNRVAATKSGGTENYTLDSLNRLTGVTYADGAVVSYPYDPTAKPHERHDERRDDSLHVRQRRPPSFVSANTSRPPGDGERPGPRMKEHIRRGKLRPADLNNVEFTPVHGSAYDRRVAEQRVIDEYDGPKNLSNKINAVAVNKMPQPYTRPRRSRRRCGIGSQRRRVRVAPIGEGVAA